MTIKYIDGFATYGNVTNLYKNNWVSSGQTDPVFVPGRFAGSQALQLFDGAQSAGVRRTFGAPQGVQEFCLGFAYRLSNAISSAQTVMYLAGNAATLYELALLTSGVLSFRYNSTRTSSNVLLNVQNLGDGNIVIGQGNWVYVELRIFDNTSFQVFVNGVLDFGGSLPQAENFQTYGFGREGVFQNETRGSITDHYLKLAGGVFNTDTLPLGDSRIDTRFPGVDVQASFIPSAGATNFENVDEVPFDDDGTFVSAANTGTFDGYRSTQVLPYNPAQIHAVQVGLVARKSDAGLRRAGIRVESAGGTVVNYPGFSLGTGYQRYTECIEKDPDGSIDWTKAKVDSLIFGPRIEV